MAPLVFRKTSCLIYCHQLRFNNTASEKPNFCPPENGKWHWNVRHSQQWLPGTSQDLWIEILHVVSNIATPKKGLAQNFQATAWYHGCTCCCGWLWYHPPCKSARQLPGFVLVPCSTNIKGTLWQLQRETIDCCFHNSSQFHHLP